MAVHNPARDLWQSIYDAVRADILTGAFGPGERLVETELAERFDTSRGPIRTALKELEREGLVRINPRRGSFVSAVSPDDVDEIFSLYEALWPLALRRAVERASDDDLVRLRALMAAIDPTRDDTTAWIEANFRFHTAIFEAADNRRLLQIWDSLAAQSRMLATELADADPGDLRATINLHPQVYGALERRDTASAERAVLQYLHQMRKLLHVGSGSTGTR